MVKIDERGWTEWEKSDFKKHGMIATYLLTLLLLSKMSFNTGQIALIIFYPFWEIYYILNQVIIGPLGFFGKITWGKR